MAVSWQCPLTPTPLGRYAASVPLFVPTLRFAMEIDMDGGGAGAGDRRVADAVYCGLDAYEPPRHPDARHPFSPEDGAWEARRFWLNMSDWYQLPHVVLFDSWDDLVGRLEAAWAGDGLAEVSAAMQATVRAIERENDRGWADVARRAVARGGAVPLSWEAARGLLPADGDLEVCATTTGR